MKENKIVTGIVFIVMAALFIIFDFTEIKGLFGKEYNLNTDLGENIPVGSRVTVGVDAVVDWYATMEHKRYGVKTSEEYYCMIWLDDGTFIGMKVYSSDKSKIDSIINATYNYLDGLGDLPTPVTFKGTLKKMKGEEKQYFEDLLEDMDYDESEFDTYARFYTIDTTSSGIPGLVIAGVFLLVGIIFIIVGVCQKKKNKLTQQAGIQGAVSNGFDPSSFDNSYAPNGDFVPYGSTPPPEDPNSYNNYNGNGYNGNGYGDNGYSDNSYNNNNYNDPNNPGGNGYGQ